MRGDLIVMDFLKKIDFKAVLTILVFLILYYIYHFSEGRLVD